MGRKGQISLEYIIITGFVLVALLIPAFIMLTNATNDNVYSEVNTQKIADLGDGIINDAKQMYYLGLYSHKVSTYTIPENTQYFYILQMKDKNTDKLYYYVGITISDKAGQSKFHYLSDIPIGSKEIPGIVEKMDDTTLNSIVPECADTDMDCTAYSFIGSLVLPGKRDFKIETLFDNSMGDSGMVVSKIYPLT